MISKQRERGLLKVAISIACLVPLGAGIAGVVLGPALVETGMVGEHRELESHFRYLSGLLLGVGIAFAACIPTIERRSELFNALCLMVFAGGLARLWGIVAYDMAVAPHIFPLLMELAVAPLLFVWQKRVGLAFSR